MWSMPVISPLAMAGAAPSTTTKRIAVSEIWNSRMANGNHTIEGMLCSPVISDPTARRSTELCETASPTTVPTSVAAAKPMAARCMVIPTACQNVAVRMISPSSWNTSAGGGST